MSVCPECGNAIRVAAGWMFKALFAGTKQMQYNSDKMPCSQRPSPIEAILLLAVRAVNYSKLTFKIIKNVRTKLQSPYSLRNVCR